MTVAVPLLNETLQKLAAPKPSESMTESLKPVTTLLNWSSAVIETLVVPPADTLLGEAETSNLLAAAGETETAPLAPKIVVLESLAVIVCVPALSKVAVTVVMPPVNETAENDAAPKMSESVTESLKPVTTLLYWSSAVAEILTVPPADTLLGEAETSNLLAAAGETETAPLAPKIVALESLAVIVCVPALSSVAVTVARPRENATAPKLAPPKLSASVTVSLKPVTTLLNWSSAVMVMLVVCPADKLAGEAETKSWLAAGGVTVIGVLVPLAIVFDTAVSVAVMVCVPAVSSEAVTVARPPENETVPNAAPLRLSAKVTVSEKPAITLLNGSSAATVTLKPMPLATVAGSPVITSCVAAAAATITPFDLPLTDVTV